MYYSWTSDVVASCVLCGSFWPIIAHFPSIKSGKMENLLKVVSSKKAGCVRQQTILWAKLLDENSSWTNLNDKIPYVDPRPHV